MHYVSLSYDHTDEVTVIINDVNVFLFFFEYIIDKLCSLTGHRFGCSSFVNVINFNDKRTKYYKIAKINEDRAKDFEHWLGWSVHD